MNDYLHGVYGQITASSTASTKQGGMVSAFVGTAPIHMIRDYADKGLVNEPIKLTSMADAIQKIGYSDDFETYTLCEVVATHFNNPKGSVGPIYVINVLDPDVAKSVETQGKEVTFVNKTGYISKKDLIPDSVAIADLVEGDDYSLDYNEASGLLTIKVLKDTALPENNKLTVTYSTIDITAVSADDIIGTVTADKQYSGLQALQLIYPKYNAVLNYLAAPGWSHIPKVHVAMCSVVQKLSGHWDGFVHADIPLEDDEGDPLDTDEGVKAWKKAHGYDVETTKSYWPQGVNSAGQVVRGSTVGDWRMLKTDVENDNIPFESPSNKEVDIIAPYFGPKSKRKTLDEASANDLNSSGITTFNYSGGKWVLWGSHTSAYEYGKDMDARAIFDTTIRMLQYITNQFQLNHMADIDKPLSPSDLESIVVQENQKLNRLVSIGALVGQPICLFSPTENTTTSLLNGDFTWHINATPSLVLKSATCKVSYTDEGLSAYLS